MKQIVDLHNDAQFQSLNVGFVSIALDSPAELATGAAEYGIQGVPLASDSDKQVSTAYNVLQWAVASGEPGHTFILVDGNGRIAWVRDYGAPPNGVMYVPPADLVQQIKANLQ